MSLTVKSDVLWLLFTSFSTPMCSLSWKSSFKYLAFKIFLWVCWGFGKRFMFGLPFSFWRRSTPPAIVSNPCLVYCPLASSLWCSNHDHLTTILPLHVQLFSTKGLLVVLGTALFLRVPLHILRCLCCPVLFPSFWRWENFPFFTLTCI